MSTKRLIGIGIIALSLPLVPAAPALAATATPASDLHVPAERPPGTVCPPIPQWCL